MLNGSETDRQTSRQRRQSSREEEAGDGREEEARSKRKGKEGCATEQLASEQTAERRKGLEKAESREAEDSRVRMQASGEVRAKRQKGQTGGGEKETRARAAGYLIVPRAELKHHASSSRNAACAHTKFESQKKVMFICGLRARGRKNM